MIEIETFFLTLSLKELGCLFENSLAVNVKKLGTLSWHVIAFYIIKFIYYSEKFMYEV